MPLTYLAVSLIALPIASGDSFAETSAATACAGGLRRACLFGATYDAEHAVGDFLRETVPRGRLARLEDCRRHRVLPLAMHKWTLCAEVLM